MKSSGIGGQAVIEGVMMKNKEEYAVAVRKPDQTIVVEKKEYHSISEKYKVLKLPILRGIVAFGESLSIGMKTLTYSADFFEEEEKEAEKKDNKESSDGVFMVLMVVISLILAIGIFMVLPWFLTEKLAAIITEPWKQALVEGGIRLGIFILYVFAISMMKDIKRVYMYHGAEHKTINCVENGLELTIENVRKQSKEHRRCGTSFMLYVMIISILLFMVIRVDNELLRILYRILMVPAIAGISYEFIRFTGKYDNLLTKILSRPGMWMQALTTREPEDDMIEVAIASVEEVFDWQAYIVEVQKENKKKEKIKTIKIKDFGADKEESKEEVKETSAKIVPLKRAEGNTRRGAYFNETLTSKASKAQSDEMEEALSESKTGDMPAKVVAAKKANKIRRPLQPIEEIRRENNMLSTTTVDVDDEDDEILSALDKFFE